MRNRIVSGQTTGRQLRWHPLSARALGDGFHALIGVLLTPGRLPSITLPVVSAGRVVQVILGVVLVFALVRARRRDVPPLVKTGLLYAGLYLLFIALTSSLFDASTPINERLLVPIVPPLVFAIAWLVSETPRIAALVICLFAVAVLQQVRTVSLYGLDYSGRIWSPARFDGVALPPGVLYSNWPAAVAYFTTRSPRYIPQTRDPHTLDINAHFNRQIDDLAVVVRAGKASLVILDERRFLEIPRLETGVTRVLGRLGTDCKRVRPVIIICQAA